MKRMTKTVLLRYTMFEKDDVVMPTSPRCPLLHGREYVFVRFVEPMGLDEYGTVFVEGHAYGVSAEYLRAREATCQG